MLVGCPQWPMYHSARNFEAPEEFIPERWLADRDARFAKEKKDVFQPFSFGPRNCIGKKYVRSLACFPYPLCYSFFSAAALT